MNSSLEAMGSSGITEEEVKELLRAQDKSSNNLDSIKKTLLSSIF